MKSGDSGHLVPHAFQYAGDEKGILLCARKPRFKFLLCMHQH